MNQPLETERFILRNLEMKDAQGMFELDSDPEVLIYLGGNPLTSIEQSKTILENVQKQYEKYKMGRWAIIDKKTQEFVGWTGLKLEKSVRDFSYYDIGYRLKKKFWGQGIATETALFSMAYGFKELNLPEICGTAHIDNIASNKVLQKIGLQFVEKIEIDGDHCNWYAISKEDWVEKNF